MKITSIGIVDGWIDDRFGSKGVNFTENGMPCLSIPFEIHDAPSETISFAFIMEDFDAIPVCGFSWIHWTLANLTKGCMDEGESRINKDIVQGVNSSHSCASDLSIEEATGYGGPAPPDGVHQYELRVYALDSMLDLENGFYMNELLHEMEGHVLDIAVIRGNYSPK